MQILITNSCFRLTSCSLRQFDALQILGKDRDICGCSGSSPKAKCSTKLCHVTKGFRGRFNALAGQKQTKRTRKQGKKQKNGIDKTLLLGDESDAVNRELSNLNYVEEENRPSFLEASDVRSSIIVPSRGAVIQACAVTSGFIGALGVLIRQVSHAASTQGWPIVDCSTNITFSFELWHLELIVGSVVLVSSCRFLLLKTWRDFAESSEAANQQVLTSLEPLDYLIVAFLPGISEELLFRGALLPLFGDTNDWIGITLVAALFGILHLGSGRKYSFAIWATFVGIVYGYATTLSSSVAVPMASHALNNLIGGLIWRYSSDSSKQIGK